MAAVVITTDSSGSFSLFFVVQFVFIPVDERLVAAVVITTDSSGSFSFLLMND